MDGPIVLSKELACQRVIVNICTLETTLERNKLEKLELAGRLAKLEINLTATKEAIQEEKGKLAELQNTEVEDTTD